MVDVTDSASMNSIAGVLKSFFRELQEPLFPLTLFDALVEASSKYTHYALKGTSISNGPTYEPGLIAITRPMLYLYSIQYTNLR